MDRREEEEGGRTRSGEDIDRARVRGSWRSDPPRARKSLLSPRTAHSGGATAAYRLLKHVRARVSKTTTPARKLDIGQSCSKFVGGSPSPLGGGVSATSAYRCHCIRQVLTSRSTKAVSSLSGRSTTCLHQHGQNAFRSACSPVAMHRPRRHSRARPSHARHVASEPPCNFVQT